jgi:hypothetical protein
MLRVAAGQEIPMGLTGASVDRRAFTIREPIRVRLSNPGRWPLQILSRFRWLISCKPSGGRELGDPIDWEVSQARQDRAKIVANRHLKRKCCKFVVEPKICVDNR